MTTMTLNTIADAGSARRSSGTTLRQITAWLRAGWMWLELWQERAIQRRHLLELDDRLLRDIGVSAVDAQREGRKPFWRP